jgi:thiol-disulfide isomerase/thioredoxin
MLHALLLSMLVLAGVPGESEEVGPELPIPKAGTVAPPLGEAQWVQLPVGAKAPTLEKLRGKVVLVHTYGYFCPSCVAVGVPTVLALRAANPDDVEVISLTSTWGDDGDRELVPEAQKLGIRHPIGFSSYFGDWSPYLNTNRHSLTYVYVVGRHGGIVWDGDPSTDLDECLAAVQHALRVPPCAPLGDAYPPELAEPVAAYVQGSFEKALDGARKIEARFAKRKDADAPKVAAAARELAEKVETTRAKLVDAVRDADGVEASLRAVHELERGFPKSAEAKDGRARLAILAVEPATASEFAAWSAWLALEAERPAQFPAKRGKAEDKFAAKLDKYLAQTPTADAEIARVWLAAHRALPAPKR